MVLGDSSSEGPDVGERRRLEAELVGLDRDDPDVQAFSEHLGRIHRQRSTFTVEGYLHGVRDFAESANRAQGLARVAAVLMVGLVLAGVAYAAWQTATFILSP
ncbi:MAG TPA: hypothetical protein VGJ13_02830 [Pseudonocardiaceae bacterium]